MKLYTPQTKIWEARTSLSECALEALFKGMSTQFGRRIVENCFENALGMVGWFGPPKSSFGYINTLRYFQCLHVCCVFF